MTQQGMAPQRGALAWVICGALAPMTSQVGPVAQEDLRQQERERALREQQEQRPDARRSSRMRPIRAVGEGARAEHEPRMKAMAMPFEC